MRASSGAIPRIVAFLALFLLGVDRSAIATGFVGSSSCRVCHSAAYEQWRTSAHAKAMDILPPANQKNAQCLACHSRDSALGGDAGVTCETCHGAGQYYWPSYVMRDAEVAKGAGLIAAPDAKSCSLCHDAFTPSLKPFDPGAAMKAIDHWSKDRAARGSTTGMNCPRRPAGTLPAGAGFLARALARK